MPRIIIMGTTALDYILAHQHESGGWGYASESLPAVEPTATVLLAIREEPTALEAFNRGLEWLRKSQNSDGGWGYTSGDEESNWLTAWAVLVLGRIGQVDDGFRGGAAWLANVATLYQVAHDEMESVFGVTAVQGPASKCWPWLPGEATWIEPTALSILALGAAEKTDEIQNRMEAGVHYFQERRCPGGGWDVGNPPMFGSTAPARTQTTACVLLSLNSLSPESILSEDIQVMRKDMMDDGGVLALSWGLLAIRTLGSADDVAQRRLDGLQGADGGWSDSPYQTSIAMLAKRGYL
jgi:hypothetical protein